MVTGYLYQAMTDFGANEGAKARTAGAVSLDTVGTYSRASI
jgi:hypothetical protein